MPIVFAKPKSPVVLTFTTTGSAQQAVIPAGVTSVDVKMWGAGGGSGTWNATSRGGGGGYSSGKLAVSGPVTLDVYVGKGGLYSTLGGAGSFPGGGDGGDGSFSNGGGGGGFSAVFPNGNFTTPFIIAGAGSGGGTNDSWPGGGLTNWYLIGPFHGQPGSQVAGGAGGTTDGVNQINPGFAGSFLTGGNGADIVSGHGGGGAGAGYYGGGGGSSGDNSGVGATAGAGSSYIGHASLTSELTLYNTDSGERWRAANETDPDYVAGANGSRGGALGNPGQAGKVIISYFA